MLSQILTASQAYSAVAESGQNSGECHEWKKTNKEIHVQPNALWSELSIFVWDIVSAPTQWQCMFTNFERSSDRWLKVWFTDKFNASQVASSYPLAKSAETGLIEIEPMLAFLATDFAETQL